MFSVRFGRPARALWPPAQALSQGPPTTPCMPLAPPHHSTPSPAPRPAPRSASHALPPFGSAGREHVQPAAQQLRHVQGHGHDRDVWGAPRACPGPQAFSRAFPSCMPPLAPPLPQALLPLGPHLSARTSHRMPSLRLSAASVGVQPAGELRHVHGHEHVPHVLRALRACLAPQPACRHGPALRAACAATAPGPPASGPTPRSHALASFRLGTVRAGVQPAAQQLRHLQGHDHGGDVQGALRSRPDPQALSRTHPPVVHTACAATNVPTPFRLPARTPRSASYALSL